jgi:hypothetical protein
MAKRILLYPDEATIRLILRALTFPFIFFKPEVRRPIFINKPTTPTTKSYNQPQRLTHKWSQDQELLLHDHSQVLSQKPQYITGRGYKTLKQVEYATAL